MEGSMKNKIISVGLLMLVIGNSVVVHASENVLATVQLIHCPVCFEDKTKNDYSSLPIFQCRGLDGEPFRHFVCSDCMGRSGGRISVCPECRAPRIIDQHQPVVLAPEQQQALQEHAAAILFEIFNGIGVDLSNANLIFANLTFANLRGANLRGANLTNADLRGASLISVDLTNSDLTNADLTSADLINADLTNANLTNANLTLANLTGTDLSRVADLEGARFIRIRGLSPENRAYAIAHGAIVED